MTGLEIYENLKSVARMIYSITVIPQPKGASEFLKALCYIENTLENPDVSETILNLAKKLKGLIEEKQTLIHEISKLAHQLETLISRPNVIHGMKSNTQLNYGIIEEDPRGSFAAACKTYDRAEKQDLRKLALKQKISTKRLRKSSFGESFQRGSDMDLKEICKQIEVANNDYSGEVMYSDVEIMPIRKYSCSSLDESKFFKSEQPEESSDYENKYTSTNLNKVKKRVSFEIFICSQRSLLQDPRQNSSCILDFVYAKRRNFKERLSKHNKNNSYMLAKKKPIVDDFKIIRKLSAGAYAKVCLVQKKNSGDYFAMKIIDKEKTMEKHEEEFITSEINILRHQNSEYIVKLYYSFQNTSYLFFIMEYMVGGDLGHLLSNCGTIDEEVFLDFTIQYSMQDYIWQKLF